MDNMLEKPETHHNLIFKLLVLFSIIFSIMDLNYYIACILMILENSNPLTLKNLIAHFNENFDDSF